jgi:hypothetical protein
LSVQLKRRKRPNSWPKCLGVSLREKNDYHHLESI